MKIIHLSQYMHTLQKGGKTALSARYACISPQKIEMCRKVFDFGKDAALQAETVYSIFFIALILRLKADDWTGKGGFSVG